MSDKTKKRKAAAKRERRVTKERIARIEQLEKEGRWINGVEMPVGAVPANMSLQVDNSNSYSKPPRPRYYVDVEFYCKDCGRHQVWTGRQQKWYYEVARGDINGTAVRCRSCRQRLKAKKELQRQQMEQSKAKSR
jgi:hypothetical protein